MRVKAFARIGDPEPLCREASVVVVEDGNGTAIAVAVDLGGNMGCMVAHAGDPEFNEMLAEHSASIA